MAEEIVDEVFKKKEEKVKGVQQRISVLDIQSERSKLAIIQNKIYRKLRSYLNKVASDFKVIPPHIAFLPKTITLEGEVVPAYFDHEERLIVITLEADNASILHEFKHYLQYLEWGAEKYKKELELLRDVPYEKRGYELEADMFGWQYTRKYDNLWNPIEEQIARYKSKQKEIEAMEAKLKKRLPIFRPP